MSSRLKRWFLDPTVFFVKLDVKDFYLSGTAEQLGNDATRGLHDDRKKLAVLILEYILAEQYIKSKWFPGRLWKSNIGSGMGLTHSGEVADTAFFFRCEKGLVDSDAARSNYGLEAYWRFRDDIAMIATDVYKMEALIKEMKRRAQYFVIKVESITWSSLRYLEVEINKRKGRYEVIPAFKQSNLGMPLDVLSCQPAHVHMSWPKAAIRRAQGLASTAAAAKRALKVLRMRFINHFAPDPIISMFDKVNITTAKLMKQKSPSPILWLTISYSPSWEVLLKKAVQAFLDDEAHRTLWVNAFGKNTEVPIIRIAWKNYLPSTSSILRQIENRAAKKEHFREDGWG